MIFNFVSITCLSLIFVLDFFLKKTKKQELIIKILLAILLTYKICVYTIENIKGNLSIPIEISSLSYFILPIIMFFNIKSFYNVAAFLGITAGLGFFGFYSCYGFVAATHFSAFKFFIAVCGHGTLLICGLYLFEKYNFYKTSKSSFWITMLSMVAWASLFIDMPMKGYPFIKYLIKPTFLYVFNSNVLNGLMVCLFVVIVVCLFSLYVNLFLRCNLKVYEKLHLKKEIKKTNIEIKSKKIKAD